MTWYYYFCFFFSSRRRHTRLVSDWSSDVCSSDLTSTVRWSECMENLLARGCNLFIELGPGEVLAGLLRRIRKDRSEERRVGKSVDLGGGRSIAKKKQIADMYGVCSESG